MDPLNPLNLDQGHVHWIGFEGQIPGCPSSSSTGIHAPERQKIFAKVNLSRLPTLGQNNVHDGCVESLSDVLSIRKEKKISVHFQKERMREKRIPFWMLLITSSYGRTRSIILPEGIIRRNTQIEKEYQIKKDNNKKGSAHECFTIFSPKSMTYRR